MDNFDNWSFDASDGNNWAFDTSDGQCLVFNNEPMLANKTRKGRKTGLFSLVDILLARAAVRTLSMTFDILQSSRGHYVKSVVRSMPARIYSRCRSKRSSHTSRFSSSGSSSSGDPDPDPDPERRSFYLPQLPPLKHPAHKYTPSVQGGES